MIIVMKMGPLRLVIDMGFFPYVTDTHRLMGYAHGQTEINFSQ